MKSEDINDAVNFALDRLSKILIITDELEIKRAMKANDCLSLLWDFNEYLRGLVKYNEDLSEAADKIREHFLEEMHNNGISLEELWS